MSDTKAPNKKDPELMPCPLCAGTPRDIGYGISCVACGLWLGDGTQAYQHGGYKQLWNRRESNEEPHP